MLEADRDAQQVLRCARARAFDRCAVLDQSLRPAEARRAREDASAARSWPLFLRGPPRRRETTACRLAATSAATRPRIPDRLRALGSRHARCGGAPARSARGRGRWPTCARMRYGSVRMPAHARASTRRARARRHAAVCTVRMRAKNSSVCPRDDRAAQDVAVPAQVLRRRVHDEVGAELQRTLQHRRRPGVIARRRGAGARCAISTIAAMSVTRMPRVRRRLHPDEPCRGTHRARPPRRRRSCRRTSPRVPSGAKCSQQQVRRAVVGVLGRNDVVAGAQRLEDGARRGLARRERRRRRRRPRAAARHASSAWRVGLPDRV